MQESWEKIITEYQKLSEELANTTDPHEMQKIGRKFSQAQKIYDLIQEFLKNENTIKENQEFLSDDGLKEMAEEEIAQAEKENRLLSKKIHELLNPKNPDWQKDAIIEIRAGTGGDEAAIFAGELAEMYLRYAELKGLKSEILNKNDSETGGVREIVFVVRGENAFFHFCYESGVHRVQRIPKTESKGRLHTSAATVYAYPEHEQSEIEIPDADIKFETFRASGPGGQSVNTTDSAVRLTHIPTGVMASCQDEKSQHKNRAKAMGILASRVIEKQREEEAQKQGAERKGKIGSGDRSEKIRTWNFPQDRLTDHRIGKNFFGLKDFLVGNLDKLIESLHSNEE